MLSNARGELTLMAGDSRTRRKWDGSHPTLIRKVMWFEMDSLSRVPLLMFLKREEFNENLFSFIFLKLLINICGKHYRLALPTLISNPFFLAYYMSWKKTTPFPNSIAAKEAIWYNSGSWDISGPPSLPSFLLWMDKMAAAVVTICDYEGEVKRCWPSHYWATEPMAADICL